MNKNRYIRWIEGKPSLVKMINGKDKYFGRYESVKDARGMRDVLEKSDWDYSRYVILYSAYKKDVLKNDSKKYIYKVSNGYEIRKVLNGKPTYFGVFRSRKNAILERNLLIDCNWNINTYFECY